MGMVGRSLIALPSVGAPPAFGDEPRPLATGGKAGIRPLSASVDCTVSDGPVIGPRRPRCAGACQEGSSGAPPFKTAGGGG